MKYIPFKDLIKSNLYILQFEDLLFQQKSLIKVNSIIKVLNVLSCVCKLYSFFKCKIFKYSSFIMKLFSISEILTTLQHPISTRFLKWGKKTNGETFFSEHFFRSQCLADAKYNMLLSFLSSEIFSQWLLSILHKKKTCNTCHLKICNM